MNVYLQRAHEHTKVPNTFCELHLRAPQKKGCYHKTTTAGFAQRVEQGTDLLTHRCSAETQVAAHKSSQQLQHMPQPLQQMMQLVFFIIPVHNSILN